MAIKSFFKFLMRENKVTLDPTQYITAQKVWQTVLDVLTYEEVLQLIEHSHNDSWIDQRDTAIIETLYATGIRSSELCSLDLDDINNDFVKVRGKGKVERLVPIGAVAQQAIQKYLELENVRKKTQRAVFVTASGNRMIRTGLYLVIQQRAFRSGFKRHVTPHSFRHAYATHLMERGANIRIIQELLGHSSLATTGMYTHVNLKQLSQDMGQYHHRFNSMLAKQS